MSIFVDKLARERVWKKKGEKSIMRKGEKEKDRKERERWTEEESPGPVLIGDDLCSRGHGFESWRPILDGHFSQ